MDTPVTLHRLCADTAPLLEGAKVFDGPVRPGALADFLADPGHEMVLACAGDRVVGFASGTVLLHPDKAPALFVNEVGVLPDMRRRGIGAAVTDRLIAIARDRGCKGIWLATEAQNTAARALYARLSARETAGIVVFDWDGAMDG